MLQIFYNFLRINIFEIFCIACTGRKNLLILLGYRQKNRRIFYSCGASLISRRYVLTAAHCHSEAEKNLQISQVVLGDHDLSTNPDCIEDDEGNRKCTNKPVQRFDVVLSDITVHEGWDPAKVKEGANDIALIRLPRPAYTALEIASGVHVVPICLPWGSLPGKSQRAAYPTGM